MKDSLALSERQYANEVTEILQQCTVEGNVLKLPQKNLDRKLYLLVAKALETLGGKWKGGKVCGFVFNSDPSALVAEYLNTLEDTDDPKKKYQFFPTPKLLAEFIVSLAEIKPSDKVLEPSAGDGAIIEAINAVENTVPDCYEIWDVNILKLETKAKEGLKFNFIGKDFLQHQTLNGAKKYDKIIANPPFRNNADITHLQQMYECLNIGGRLICITSTAWANAVKNGSKKQKDFLAWLNTKKHQIIEVENRAFIESGTPIATRIVIIDKIIMNYK